MSSHIIDRGDGQTKRTLHLRIPPDPIFARTVRDAIIGFGSLHGIDDSDLDSILFAIGEALANAIEHSSSGEDIEILAEIDDRRIVATVIDRGQGLRHEPQNPQPLPEGLEARGRGIPIMQRFTDIFNVKSTPGAGTAITLGRWRRTYENAGRGSSS
jgi:anti-sigma regulatory factor (Ser/Thr protein kinase)